MDGVVECKSIAAKDQVRKKPKTNADLILMGNRVSDKRIDFFLGPWTGKDLALHLHQRPDHFKALLDPRLVGLLHFTPKTVRLPQIEPFERVKPWR